GGSGIRLSVSPSKKLDKGGQKVSSRGSTFSSFDSAAWSLGTGFLLLQSNEQRPGLDRVARRTLDAFHAAGGLGANLVLHLHRFENDERHSRCDAVSGGDPHLDDPPRDLCPHFRRLSRTVRASRREVPQRIGKTDRKPAPAHPGFDASVAARDDAAGDLASRRGDDARPATGKRREVDEMLIGSFLDPSLPVARDLDDELGGRAVLAAPPEPATESHRRRRPSPDRSAAARAVSLHRDRSRAGRGDARPAASVRESAARNVSSAVASRATSRGDASQSSSHCVWNLPLRKSGWRTSSRKSGSVVSTPVTSYSSRARANRSIAVSRSGPKTTSFPNIGS